MEDKKYVYVITRRWDNDDEENFFSNEHPIAAFDEYSKAVVFIDSLTDEDILRNEVGYFSIIKSVTPGHSIIDPPNAIYRKHFYCAEKHDIVMERARTIVNHRNIIFFIYKMEVMK